MDSLEAAHRLQAVPPLFMSDEGVGKHIWVERALLLAEGMVLNPDTPTLNTTYNNYTAGNSSYWDTTLTGDTTITGIVAATPGTFKYITNLTSGYYLTLVHQSSSSDAANRITIQWAGDLVLAQYSTAVLVYIDATVGWLLIGLHHPAYPTWPVHTPANIGSSQNDYAVAAGHFARINPTANINLTGFAARPNGSGFWLVNTNSTYTATIKHDSASSSTANRVYTSTGSDIALGPGEMAYLWYDGTSSRWRAAKVGASGPAAITSLTDHGVLVGSGTAPIDALAVGTNGQLLIGQTGADPAFTTVSGAITIDNAGTTSVGTIPGRLIGIQVKTSGTTYTSSAGVTKALIRMVGGGGGGGGATRAATPACGVGGGGSGGGYLEKLVTVTPANNYTIAIGTGGNAGANTGGDGGTGNDTTFNDGTTTYTAKGGTGGAGLTQGTTQAFRAGGATPISTNGDVNSAGEAGGIALRLSGTVACSGKGGDSMFGTGGQGSPVQAAGTAGKGYGAGGAGAAAFSADVAGAAGTDGVIVIYEFS